MASGPASASACAASMLRSSATSSGVAFRAASRAARPSRTSRIRNSSPAIALEGTMTRTPWRGRRVTSLRSSNRRMASRSGPRLTPYRPARRGSLSLLPGANFPVTMASLNRSNNESASDVLSLSIPASRWVGSTSSPSLASRTDVALLQFIKQGLVDQALPLLEAGNRAVFIQAALALELAERRLHAVNRPLQRDIGVEHQREAQFVERLKRHDRGTAAHHQIDQLRCVLEPCRDIADFIDALGRFHEGDVGAVLDKRLRPFDGRRKALGGAGIGAGNDQQIGVLPGIDRRLDTAACFPQVHHILAGKVTAALRTDLVFELNGAGTGPLQGPDGVPDIECVAEAGIGIHHNRQIGRVTDRGGMLGNLGQADKAQVGHAEIGIGQPGARQIDRLKSQIGNDAGGQRIGGPRHQYRATPVEPGTEGFVDLMVEHDATPVRDRKCPGQWAWTG